MNIKRHPVCSLYCGLLSLALIGAFEVSAQNDDVYELNPFEVNSDQDRGYSATETISGIGVSMAIKDLPLTTNVITSEFLEDNLVGKFNEALDYSTSLDFEIQAGSNYSLRCGIG